MQIIWEKFLGYVTTRKDEVSIDEFVVITTGGEEEDIFLRLVFLLFDDNMSGCIGFPEFLRAMYHYMTLEVEDLELFTFQIFDLDGGGELESEEINFMISLLWGGHNSPKKLHHIQESMQQMDQDMSGAVDAVEWLAIVRRFPNLMFPAFSLQLKLRRNTMSESRWAKITEHRNKVDRKKQYEDVREIADTHRKVAHGYAFLALKACGKLPRSVQAKVDEAQNMRDEEHGQRTLNIELGRPLDYHHKKADGEQKGSHGPFSKSVLEEAQVKHDKEASDGNAAASHGAHAAKGKYASENAAFDPMDPYHMDKHKQEHHSHAVEHEGGLSGGFHGKAHNPHTQHETQKEKEAHELHNHTHHHDEKSAFRQNGYSKVSHNEHGGDHDHDSHAHVDTKKKKKPGGSMDDDVAAVGHSKFMHHKGTYNEL